MDLNRTSLEKLGRKDIAIAMFSQAGRYEEQQAEGDTYEEECSF